MESLYTNVFKFSITSKFIVMLLLVIELVEILIYCAEPWNRFTEYPRYATFLSGIFYLSQTFYLEKFNSIMNDTCPIISGNTTQNVTNTTVISFHIFLSDEGYCRYSNIFLGIICFLTCFITLIVCLFHGGCIVTKLKKRAYEKVLLKLMSLFFQFTNRTFAISFYMIYVNYLFNLFSYLPSVKSMNLDSEYSLYVSDYIFFVPVVLVICCHLNFNWYSLYYSVFYAHPGYPFDFKQANTEKLLLLLKLLITLDFNLRKFYKAMYYIPHLNFHFVIRIAVLVLLFVLIFWELCYNYYVCNHVMNYFRLFLLIIAEMFMLSNIIPFFQNIVGVFEKEIFQYLIILGVSSVLILYKIKIRDQGITVTGMFTNCRNSIEENINQFLDFSLNFYFSHILRSTFPGESSDKTLLENLHLLNYHTWNCEFHKCLSLKIIGNNAHCPLCKTLNKYYKVKGINVSDTGYFTSISDINMNIVLLALYKTVKFIEKEFIFSSTKDRYWTFLSHGISFNVDKININDYYNLKLLLIEILYPQKLIKLCWFKFEMKKLTGNNSKRVEILNAYFKEKVKINLENILRDYKIFGYSENCKLLLNNVIDLSHSFSQSIQYKSISYKKLLTDFINIGESRSIIQKKIYQMSTKLKSADNSHSVVIFNTVYRFLFNREVDKSIALSYDIDNNYIFVDDYYNHDNLIILRYDVEESRFTIVKFPASPKYTNVFTQTTSDFASMFPHFVKNEQKSLLIKKLQQNWTNGIVMHLLIQNIEGYISKVVFNMKVLSDLEREIKVYCTVNIQNGKGVCCIEEHGRLLGVSEEFAQKIQISPGYLKKNPHFNMKTLLASFKQTNSSRSFVIKSLQENDVVSSSETPIKENQLYKNNDKVNQVFEIIIDENFQISNDKCHVYQLILDSQNNMKSSISNQNLNTNSIVEENNNIYIGRFSSSVCTSSTISALSCYKDSHSTKYKFRQTQQTVIFIQNSKSIKSLCKVILLINILSIIIGIVFLLMIKSNLDYISNTFQAIQSYQLLVTRMYINLMMISTLITLKDENGEVRDSDFLYELMNPSVDAGYKIDYADYIKQEVAHNLDKFSNTAKEMRRRIYSYFPEDFIHWNINIETELFQLVFSDKEDYRITPKRLFDIFDYFYNTLVTYVFADEKYHFIEVIGISCNATYIKNINDFLLDEDNDELLIESIINIPKNIISKALKAYQNLVNFEIEKLEELKQFVLYCLMTLLLLNIILVVLILLMIRIYKQNVHAIANELYSMDNDTLIDLTKKFRLLKEILNYVREPKSVLFEIRDLVGKYSHKDTTNHKQCCTKLIGKDADNAENVKAINHQGMITQYYIKVSIGLLIIILLFFCLTFFYSNNFITEILHHSIFISEFFSLLQIPSHAIINLNMMVFLNKTNIEDDYFKQSFAVEQFVEESMAFYPSERYVITFSDFSDDSFAPLRELLFQLSSSSACENVSQMIIHNFNFTTSKLKEQDITDTLIYICKKMPITQTDLFTLLHDSNKNVRTLFYQFISLEKTKKNLKEFIDSQVLFELGEIGSLYIRGVFIHLIEDIFIPIFQTFIDSVFLNLAAIFVMNIVLASGVLAVGYYFVLKKVLHVMDNLNILLEVLTI